MPPVALIRSVTARLADGIVTHLDRQPVDPVLARRQHAAYGDALRAAGWQLRSVPEAPDHPDSVFVEDTVVLVGGLAVLTRPGAPERRGEVAGVEPVLRDLGLEVRRIEAPGTVEGGDVLQIGSVVYVGRSGRTNDAGIEQLATLIEPLGRTVVPVDLAGTLHLKSAVTALPDGTAIGLDTHVDRTRFDSWRSVTEEPGCHVVLLGENRLLMAASARHTAAELAAEGYDVMTVDISEFEKLEGCVTCLSVLVP